jgi:hypothetical protein
MTPFDIQIIFTDVFLGIAFCFLLYALFTLGSDLFVLVRDTFFRRHPCDPRKD